MENDTLRDNGKVAQEYFEQGFNCAQSVLSSFTEQLGLDRKAALRMTSILGGGVARRGEICGAVSGALLALGLALGTQTPEGKEDAYRLGQQFLQRFEARHKTILCRELVGFDISKPEEREKARQSGVFKTNCPLFVRDAANIVQAMIVEAGKQPE